MYARELASAFAKVKDLLKIEGGFDLDNIISQLENAVTNPQLFDVANIESFKESKQSVDGRYKIYPSDTNLIKNTKSLINLLRSIQSINIDIFNKLIEYINTDKDKKIERVTNFASFGYMAIKDGYKLKQFHNDIKAFLFYIKKLNELLPDLPKLGTEAKEQIQKFQDEFYHLELNQVLEVINIESDEHDKEKLRVPVPNINMNEIMSAITHFDLEKAIDSVIDISIYITDRSDTKNYNKNQDRFLLPVNDQQLVYNSCRDIKKWMNEASSLILKITNHPFYNLPDVRWCDLNEGIREDYIKLNTHLKNIKYELEKVEILCRDDPSLKKMLGRIDKHPKNILDKWSKSDESRNIDALSIGVKKALDVIHAVAAQEISTAKYFDSKLGIYVIPQEGVSDTQKNLMLISNISFRAKQVLQRIQAAQIKMFPSNLQAALGALEEIGNVVKDFKALNLQVLQADSKAAIATNVQMIFKQLLPFLQKTVILTLETELRLGLKNGALLDKLDPLLEQAQILIDGLKLEITIPRKPYKTESEIAYTHIKSESAQRLKLLSDAKRMVPQQHDSIYKTLELIEILNSINTYNAYEYSLYLQESINKMTGLDILESEIKSLESGIVKSMAKERLISSRSLLAATDDAIHEMVLDETTRANIKSLRQLYDMREKLQAMISKCKAGVHDSNNLEMVDLFHFSKNKDAGYVKNLFRRETDYKLTPGLKSVSFSEQEALRRTVLNDVDSCIKHEKTVHTNMGHVTLNAKDAISTKPQIVVEASDAKQPSPISMLEVDDHVIIKQLMDKAKGPIILQSEAARKKLIESALKVLSDNQKEQLNLLRRVNGLYLISEDDQSLCITVKAMYNTMARFENLMHLVNKLQKIVGGGILDYRKIPELIAAIKNSIQDLLKEIDFTNDALYLLRKHLQHILPGSDEFNIIAMISEFTQQLPAQLQLLGNDIQLKLIDVLDPEIVNHIKTLSSQGKKLADNSIELIPSRDIIKFEVNTGLITNIQSTIIALKHQITSAKTNPDGSYDLTQFEQGSSKKCIATVINASYKVISALNQAERYSSGHPITGFFGVLTNLYSAWSLIKESEVISHSEEVKKVLRENYNKLNEILKSQITACLRSFIPLVKQTIAQAAISETILGLDEDILLDQLKPYLDKFITLGTEYNVDEIIKLQDSYPYLTTQRKLAQDEQNELEALQKDKSFKNEKLLKHQMNLVSQYIDKLKQQHVESTSSSLQQSVSVINAEDYELDSWKVRTLIAACIDYKHHLAKALSVQLEQVDPYKDYYIDLNSKFRLSQALKNVTRDDSILRLTIAKYNAVQSLQATLQSSHRTSKEKLSDFSQCFNKSRNLFNLSRDTAGITFLKVIATIFSFGLAALFGIWKPYGEKVSNKMGEIIAPQPPTSLKST